MISNILYTQIILTLKNVYSSLWKGLLSQAPDRFGNKYQTHCPLLTLSHSTSTHGLIFYNYLYNDTSQEYAHPCIFSLQTMKSCPSLNNCAYMIKRLSPADFPSVFATTLPSTVASAGFGKPSPVTGRNCTVAPLRSNSGRSPGPPGGVSAPAQRGLWPHSEQLPRGSCVTESCPVQLWFPEFSRESRFKLPVFIVASFFLVLNSWSWR